MSARISLLPALTAWTLTAFCHAAPPSPPRPDLVDTLKGHSLCVYHAAFCPDGRLLATSSKDKTVKLWSADGKEVRTLRGHTGQVYSSAFRPDGKRLATASEDQTVKVWDVADGKELRTLRGHRNEVYHVVFSPDGRTIASAGQDQTVGLWDAETGKPLRTLSGHTSRVCSVAFRPDGKLLASASPTALAPGEEDAHGELILWDAGSGAAVWSLSANVPGVVSIAFSPDGRRLAGACMDKTVKVWETASGREALSLKGHALPVYSVAFSADGRYLASSSCDWRSSKPGEVKLWELPSGRELLSFRPHPTPIWSVVFRGDSKRLATTTGLWPLDKGERDVPGEVKLWQLTDLPPRPASAPPAPAQLESLWNDLAGVDAGRAYRAVWTLSASPKQSLPFLRDRVRPFKSRGTRAELARLIRNLDSDEFAVREKASAALEQLGRLARPALREALTKRPTLEVRRRIEGLLEKKIDERPPLTVEEARGLRVVEVLVRIGTSETKPVLEKLARGGAESPITKEAVAALEQLRR
jgi:WD40 repeat protein